MEEWKEVGSKSGGVELLWRIRWRVSFALLQEKRRREKGKEGLE